MQFSRFFHAQHWACARITGGMPVPFFMLALVALVIPAGAADLTFTSSTVITGAGNCAKQRLADLDVDGDLDVLIVDYKSPDGRLSWYENTGTPTAPAFTFHAIATGLDQPHDSWIAELNGDGRPDLLSAIIGQDTVAWYRNSGAAPPAFTAQNITQTPNGVYSVCAADLNGDGRSDPIAAGGNGLRLAWYRNGGGAAPTFTETYIADYPGGVMALEPADLDRDGDMDIVTNSYWMNEVAWIENTGGSSPTLIKRVIDNAMYRCQFAAVADLDGDGDPDILSLDSGDDLAAWYENDGVRPPTFTRRDITLGFSSTASFNHLTPADIDHDGDLDLLLTTRGTGGNFYWLENNGARPPSFAPHILGAGINDGASPCAADLNHDGLLDILLARTNGNVVYYAQTSPPIVTDQPENATVVAGLAASFAVAAIGRMPLRYQWWKDGAKLANGGRIDGATSPTLSISGTTSADAGRYTCVVNNLYGQDVSQSAYLTVQRPGQLAASPAELRFPEGTAWAVDVEHGGAPTTRTLTLTNTGDLPVTINQVRLYGSAVASFHVIRVTPATTVPVGPGGSVTVVVEFAPTVLTRTLGLSAWLEVSSNSPVTPLVTIPLSGDAVPVGFAAFMVY